MADKRNQPCPCGSGKRHKKCCGLAGIKAVLPGAAMAAESPEETEPAAEYFRLGEAAARQGDWEEAAGCFRQGLNLQPNQPDALNILGIIYLTQSKLDKAVGVFRQALALQPDFIEVHFNLGVAFYDLGRLDEAVASMRRVLALQPDYSEAHFNLGNFLMAQGHFQEAAAVFRQALVLKPDYAEALCNLGVIYNELGRKEDAITSFRQAISLKPGYVRAYKGLSQLAKYTDVDVDIQAMEDLYTKRDMPEADRRDLGFALGNFFEDLGEYDKAFTFYSEANRLKRKSFQYSIENDHILFERIKEVFSPEFFSSHTLAGNQDNTPIFILGMPRSGTTLVEQVLASHPLVFGAGELADLVNLTNKFCAGRNVAQFPECVTDFSPDVLAAMGADYVAGVRKYANDAKFITDKMPHNFLRVGLIRAILPRAKIIHCMRNPMDTCLSIFKMDFTAPHGYAYDLVELGRYFTLYQDLMAHWEKVLPDFMHTVQYEEMVADQRQQTKDLLDFCRLPWDDACLAFHRTARRVSTASLVQVRQPIYKDSLDLWKRYEKQLELLRGAIYGSGG